jgi:hypothetical protein
MNETTKRPWNRTSASQHAAYQRCKRYWYFGWIDRIKGPKTDAMQRGTDIHTETEHYLLTGQLRDSCYSEFNLNYRPYVEALVPHLPPPMHDELIVEHGIDLQCGEDLPSWVGFIDIGYSAPEILQIRDLKTTSDFRYAKTEEELSENIQLISYGKWAYEVAGHTGEIDLGHINLKTEKRLVRKKPKVKPVNVIVSQAHVEDVWDREMLTVAEMVEAAKAESAHDLPPTITACGDFGGCPHSVRCGLPEMSIGGLFKLNEKKGKDDMGNAFLKKLKEKNAAKAGKGGDVKILPDDAPARETSDEESEKIRAEAEAKKEKAEAAAAKKAEKAAKKAEKEAAKEAAKEASKKPAKGTSDFVVYLNCMPKKNLGAEAPVLFEDWFKPLFDELDASCAQENNAGYWAMSFSDQKAVIAGAVSMYIEEKGLPGSMIAMTGTTLLSDVLPCLVPHASQVITGLRG